MTDADKCYWLTEEGGCEYEGACLYQRGKWKDTCGLYQESEGEEEE